MCHKYLISFHDDQTRTLCFHNEPFLILNIWTRTADSNIHHFPWTVSPTCNYWSIKCSMCGRYCSNRAAALFWNDCTRQALLCVHVRACVRACVCVGLHRWVIRGTKRALTLTGCCRSDEKIVVVCGSQSDSPPLQVSTEEEVLRWTNVRRAAILPLERSSSSKGDVGFMAAEEGRCGGEAAHMRFFCVVAAALLDFRSSPANSFQRCNGYF